MALFVGENRIKAEMFMYLCGLFNDTGNSWAVCRPMLGVIDER
jgi:hypothetical protein